MKRVPPNDNDYTHSEMLHYKRGMRTEKEAAADGVECMKL
jgi:hypothetical protein